MKNVIKTMKRKLYRIVNLCLSIGTRDKIVRKLPLHGFSNKKKLVLGKNLLPQINKKQTKESLR